MAEDLFATSTNPEKPMVADNLLREAIQAKEERTDVVIINKNISSGSDNINNYCSVGYFVTLTAQVGSCLREYQLFVKQVIEDEARKEYLLGKHFQGEAKMYSELIPSMMNMQREKCGYVFGPSVPEYYHSIVSRDTGVVILQDYKPDGYRVTHARESLSYGHCELAMREIAIFHALSWTMKNEILDYIKKYPFLSKSHFNEPPIDTAVESEIRSVIELVKMRMMDKTLKETILKLLSINFNQTRRHLCQPIEPYAVLCNGDFHLHNIMFKNIDAVVANSPVKLKLIDMQAAAYAPPTIDLAVFFFTSTTRDTRKRYLKDLLHIYHKEFIRCLDKLNLTFEEFSFTELHKQFVKSTPHGLLMSCVFLSHLMCDREDHKSNRKKSTDSWMKATGDFAKLLPVICDKVPAIQERLFDNLRDLIEIDGL